MSRENLIDTLRHTQKKMVKKMVKIKEVSFDIIKTMTVGEVRKLDKAMKKFKVPNVQLVRDYGKKIPL